LAEAIRRYFKLRYIVNRDTGTVHDSFNTDERCNMDDITFRLDVDLKGFKELLSTGDVLGEDSQYVEIDLCDWCFGEQ
jgi:hypothetical protein